MLKLLLIISVAHSGAWSRFCESLISNSNDQYEMADDDWLLRQLDRLEIKAKWSSLRPDEIDHLKLIRLQIKFRNSLKVLNNPAE